MSESYGEKVLARQRVCSKCRSFVTLERVNDKQFGCPLCGQRLSAYVNLQPRIDAAEIRALVDLEHLRKASK